LNQDSSYICSSYPKFSEGSCVGTFRELKVSQGSGAGENLCHPHPPQQNTEAPCWRIAAYIKKHRDLLGGLPS